MPFVASLAGRMAQSLEELTNIYSETSELGLTSLGVTQPEDEEMIEQSTASVLAEVGVREVREYEDSDMVSSKKLAR